LSCQGNSIHCPLNTALHVLAIKFKRLTFTVVDENKEINHGAAHRPCTVFTAGVYYWKHYCMTML
jgi:hypothetical protein